MKRLRNGEEFTLSETVYAPQKGQVDARFEKNDIDSLFCIRGGSSYRGRKSQSGDRSGCAWGQGAAIGRRVGARGAHKSDRKQETE